jgi:hypothetical protein
MKRDRNTAIVWRLAVLVCLLASLTAVVVATHSREATEHRTSELVEVEECEAITRRPRQRRRQRVCIPPLDLPAALAGKPATLLVAVQPRLPRERDRHNGIGTWLLI